jgi:hypothetical protein
VPAGIISAPLPLDHQTVPCSALHDATLPHAPVHPDPPEFDDRLRIVNVPYSQLSLGQKAQIVPTLKVV